MNIYILFFIYQNFSTNLIKFVIITWYGAIIRQQNFIRLLFEFDKISHYHRFIRDSVKF